MEKKAAYQTYAKYVGGHPKFRPGVAARINVDEVTLTIVLDKNNILSLPYSAIENIQALKGEKEIDWSLLPLIGIGSIFFRKKPKLAVITVKDELGIQRNLALEFAFDFDRDKFVSMVYENIVKTKATGKT